MVPVNLATGTAGSPIRIDVARNSGSLTDIVRAPSGAAAYVTQTQVAARPENDTVVPADVASGKPGAPICIATGPVYQASVAIAPRGTPIQIGSHVEGAAVAVGSDGTSAYLTTTARGNSYQSQVTELHQAR